MSKVSVFCYWGGDIINTHEGLSYSVNKYKIVRVYRDTNYEGLKEKLFEKIGISSDRFRLKLICRLPNLNLNNKMEYIGVEVDDDESVETMLAVTDIPGRIFVELYVQVEEKVAIEPDLGQFGQYSQLISGEIGIEDIRFEPNSNEYYSNANLHCTMSHGASSSSMVPSAPQEGVAMSPFSAVQRIQDPEHDENEDEDEDLDYSGEEDDDEEEEEYYEEEEELHGEEENEVCFEEGEDRMGNEGGDIEMGNATDATPINVHVPMAPFITQTGIDELYDSNIHRNAVYPVSWNPEHEDPFVGLLFTSKELMKKAMKLWSIQRRVQYGVTYSKSKYWDICCKKYGENSCLWRFRACKRKRSELWEVTIYDGPHTCVYARLTDDHHQLDSDLIAQIIRPTIADDPSTKVKAIIKTIHVRFEKWISYKKAWVGKQKAIASIFGDWENSYRALPKFMQAMQRYNPNTIVDFCTPSITADVGQPDSSAQLDVPPLLPQLPTQPQDVEPLQRRPTRNIRPVLCFTEEQRRRQL